jgi:hypothetical protein
MYWRMAARKAERSTAAKDAKSAAPRREPGRGQVISYQVVMDARRRPTLPADLLSSAHIDGSEPLFAHALVEGRIVLETRDAVKQRIRDSLRAKTKGKRNLSEELLVERQAEAALES